MIDINQYIKKVGVTKKSYVQKWIDHGQIPGVQKDKDGNYQFPDSARRPYQSRCNSKSTAKVIRGAIVNACLKRQYISADTFSLSEKEFDSYVTDLIRAELIVKREEDGIVYYDSTLKSDSVKGEKASEIVKWVNRCICVLEPVLSIAASTLAIGATQV